jgi:hypothetical protein
MWLPGGSRDAARQAAVQYGGWGWRVAPAHYARLPGRHRRTRRGRRRLDPVEGAGGPPLRCSCEQRGCTAPGGHPVGRDWLRDASTDRTIIESWWWGARPWNVALVTGELFDAWTVPRGVARYALAAIESGGRPLGPVAYGPGGWLFLTEPSPVEPPAALAAVGIGHVGEGGYVLAPPSDSAGGRLRWWRSPFGPGTPRLPPWEPTVDGLLTAAQSGRCLARME